MSGRREERLKVRARRCAALLASVFVTSLAGQVLIGPVAAQAATAPRAPAPILPPAHPPAPPAIAPAPESYTTFSHSKRDASGRVTAQLFTVPQFRRQGGGWVPIDASVRPRNDRVQPLSAEGGLRPIRLGSSASRLVELELDRGPVTMSAPSLSIGAPEATLGGATYHNVAADTDLRYRVSAGGIKEEVVLRSPQSPRQFTFHIDDPRGQLGAAHRQADGSYRFDGRIDDAVVSLAAPAAYPEPKAGVRGGIPMDRRSAHMAVKPVGKGVDVTLSVDASWLVGKSFPIVLDPDTIMSQGVSLAGHSEYSPDFCGTGCGLNTTDDVGAYTGYSREGHQLEPMRSFYKFDLSSIPFGSAVSSATFSQYLVGCGDGAGCGQYAYSFEVHPMTGPWDQYSIWSDLAAKTSSTVTDHVEVAPITCSPCGSESWNGLLAVSCG